MTGHIHSKDGGYGSFEIIDQVGDNDYLVRTEAGIKCHAIFNPFAGWFVDDVYAVEEETK